MVHNVAVKPGDAAPVVVVKYNGTNPNGGDSQFQDLNVHYETGNIAFIIICTALVLLMIPGIG